MSIGIGGRILVVQDPVVRDNPRVELAHQALADIVDAMLVMALVHLRYTLLLVLHLGEVVHVVVLPDVVQAVQLVRPYSGRDVSTANLGRELSRPVGVLDLLDVFLRDTDHTIYIYLYSVQEVPGYAPGLR